MFTKENLFEAKTVPATVWRTLLSLQEENGFCRDWFPSPRFQEIIRCCGWVEAESWKQGGLVDIVYSSVAGGVVATAASDAVDVGENIVDVEGVKVDVQDAMGAKDAIISPNLSEKRWTPRCQCPISWRRRF